MRITKETYIDTFIVIDKHTNIDRNTNKIETHINCKYTQRDKDIRLHKTTETF